MPGRKVLIIPTEHLFDERETQFVVEEVICVSDVLKDSHWPYNSSENADKFEILGKFQANISSWRKRGWVEKQIPFRGGRPHYEVTYDIVLELIGLGIHCWARWPSRGRMKDRYWEVDEKVTLTPEDINFVIPESRMDFYVGASFEPGTE